MKILLIEDHRMFAEGVNNGLKLNDKDGKIEEIDFICDRFKLDYLLGLIAQKRYDIIFIDINIFNIYEEDGLVLTSHILSKFPEINIIILTGYDRPIFELEARKSGAKAFVDKNKDSKELYQILADVYNGDYEFENCEVEGNLLTEREIEIVKLYAGGSTREQIAKKIFVSPRTLANHLINIYDKLGVSNYQEMTLKALELGYIREFNKK